MQWIRIGFEGWLNDRRLSHHGTSKNISEDQLNDKNGRSEGNGRERRIWSKWWLMRQRPHCHGVVDADEDEGEKDGKSRELRRTIHSNYMLFWIFSLSDGGWWMLAALRCDDDGEQEVVRRLFFVCTHFYGHRAIDSIHLSQPDEARWGKTVEEIPPQNWNWSNYGRSISFCCHPVSSGGGKWKGKMRFKQVMSETLGPAETEQHVRRRNGDFLQKLNKYEKEKEEEKEKICIFDYLKRFIRHKDGIQHSESEQILRLNKWCWWWWW